MKHIRFVSFVELAFAELGYEIEWQGEGVNEKGNR